MWLNNNKPPIWEWFIQTIHGDLGDGLFLVHMNGDLMVISGDLVIL